MGCGAVLALVAGARRTDSAIDRFVDRANPWDVQITSGLPGVIDFAVLDLDQVRRLPGVTDSTPVHVMGVVGTTSDGVLVGPQIVNFTVDPSGRAGKDLDRVKMLKGRQPDPRDPSEVLLSFRTAEEVGLDVGETMSVSFLAPSQLGVLFEETQAGFERLAASGSEVLRVVGIYATARELVKAGPEGIPHDVRLTPAAFERHPEAVVLDQANIVLSDGRRLDAFLEQVRELGGSEPVFTASLPDFVEAATDAVSPVSRALALGALLLGTVVVLLGGQALARQAVAEAGDDRVLVSLGFTGSRLAAVRTLKAAAIGAIAALTAVVVAAVAAPVFPIGLADIIEPDPGFRFDVLVLTSGAFTVAVVFAGLGAGAGWWGTRRALMAVRMAHVQRTPQLMRLLISSGARPPVVAGVQAALRPGAGRALSASLGTMTLGLVATIGATTFGASLGHLTDTPALYGWNWDVRIGQPFSRAFGPERVDALRNDPALTALAIGNEAEVDLDGRRLSLLATENVVGDIRPSLLSGRAATDVDDVVVAPGVADVGERLTITYGEATSELLVVGVAALPDACAAVTLDTLRRPAPGTPTQLALARVRDPAELVPFAARATAALGLDPLDQFFPELNQDVANFGRVGRLPAALAALMGLVAVGTLLHALLLSVRVRRRELAVLKTLGFTRGQLLVTVASQATALLAFSMAIGVPVGLTLGRGLWLRFANGLGVVPLAVVPALSIAAIVLGSLLVANATAVGPGWRAARTPAALALRTE